MIPQSKKQFYVQDGIYCGVMTGYTMRIVSADHSGLSFQSVTEGMRGSNIMGIIVVKNGIAYFFTQSISVKLINDLK